MRCFLISLLIVCIGSVNAQPSIYSEVLNNLFPTSSSKEHFKGQFIKGKRSGMGCLKEKNGTIYIGDFNKNAKTGIGMQFSPEGKFIKNCDGAVVYTGGFKNGKKNGKGCCYAPNGDLIYEGDFIDDKPVSVYPLPEEDVDINRYFSLFETDNYSIFIGEVNKRVFTGLGVIVFEDGEFYYGMMSDNYPSGVVLHVLPDEEWNVVNIDGDEMVTLSSSERYRQLAHERSEINKNMRRDLFESLNYFAEGALTAAQLVNDIKSGGSVGAVGDSEDTAYEDDNSDLAGGSSKKKSKASSKKTKADCGTAWVSDSRSYAEYDSQLANMDTYPEKYDASDRSRIRSKMKSIREKWEARGCTITKSHRE